MKKALAIIFFLCANYVFAQDSTAALKPAPTGYRNDSINPAPIDTAGKVFVIVEQMPSFPGGEKKLLKFVKKNTKYPKEARRKGIEGRVYVNFVVDAEGMVKNVRVVRGVSPELDEEAIRVVKLMPKWKPGKQGGKPIMVSYNLPFIFKLK